MSTDMSAGQAVRNLTTGAIGITTDAARKRTAQIAVQWIGGPYPVLMQLDELEGILVVAEDQE